MYEDYNINVSNNSEGGLYVGIYTVSKTNNYIPISISSIKPILGINMIQCCGLRGIIDKGEYIDYTFYYSCNAIGNGTIRVTWFKQI